MMVIDSVSINGLRPAHFKQLRSYLDSVDFYYGRRDQFDQRHADLINWVDSIIDLTAGNDVIIPKAKRR